MPHRPRQVSGLPPLTIDEHRIEPEEISARYHCHYDSANPDSSQVIAAL